MHKSVVSFSPWWSSCGPDRVYQETHHAIHVAAITNVFKKTSDLIPLHENVVSFLHGGHLRLKAEQTPGVEPDQ